MRDSRESLIPAVDRYVKPVWAWPHRKPRQVDSEHQSWQVTQLLLDEMFWYPYALVVRQQMQLAADAAALAGARYLYEGGSPNWTQAADETAKALSLNTVDQLALQADAVDLGYWNATSRVWQPTTISPTAWDIPAVRVQVSRSGGRNGGDVKTIFANWENRMPTQYDKGYGNGWEDETHEENVVMNHKFTLDLFNQTFNEVKAKKLEKLKGNQVMKIDAPEPQLLSNLAYEELGQDNIEDFTSGVQENMNFVDYKAAYTKANVLEYDEKYNRGDYKNLDSLVRARDTQSFTVSSEDRQWINRQEQYEKQREQKRIDNMMAFDRMAEVYSNRANQHFIKNK